MRHNVCESTGDQVSSQVCVLGQQEMGDIKDPYQQVVQVLSMENVLEPSMETGSRKGLAF